MTSADHTLSRHATAWFGRLDRGALSPQEQAAFDAWYQNPAHAQAFNTLKTLWQSDALHTALLATEQHTAAGETPKVPAPQKRRPSFLPFPRAMAAAFSLVALVGISFWALSPPNLDADYVAAPGELRHITLEDGSQVLLSGGSGITLAFGATERRVSLVAGKAFFTVTPDTARPFHVETDKAWIVVTGTAFSVSRSPETDQVHVLEGHVQVSPAMRADATPTTETSKASHHLTANTGLAISANAFFSLPTESVQTGLDWIDGRLSFRNRPLGEVLATLAPYLADSLYILNDDAQDKAITGFFSLKDPEAAIQAAAQAAGAQTKAVPGVFLVVY